jgi:hypothetical protein
MNLLFEVVCRANTENSILGVIPRHIVGIILTKSCSKVLFAIRVFVEISGDNIKLCSKVLFGTRVFVEISGDNPHQIPNSHLLLKIYLILEY